MIKAIALAKRKAGMAADDFHRYWRKQHAPLVLQMSAMRRYVQSHRTTDVMPGFENCPYDGVAELWFDDLVALNNLPNDPEYINGAQADEANFVDMDALVFLATREHVLIDETQPDPDKPLLKAIFLLRRRADMSVADFQDYWINGHAPQIPRDAGIIRYAQCHQVPETYAEQTPAYDGVAELAFKDYAAFSDYWNSERIQEIFAADAPRFMDAANCTAFLAEDYVVR